MANPAPQLSVIRNDRYDQVFRGGGQANRSDLMTDTDDLTDAKLATVEARAETRFVELSGKIDRVADSIAVLNTAVSGVRSELVTAKAEVKDDNKLTRWTIGVTIIASLIAFAAALWVTQGNMLAAFQSGIAVRSEQAPPQQPTTQIPKK